jgi:hypothetical protein
MPPDWKYENHPADRSLKEDLSIDTTFDPSYISRDTPFNAKICDMINIVGKTPPSGSSDRGLLRMRQHSDLRTSKANGRLPTHTYHYLDGQVHLVRLQTDNFCLFRG